MISEIYQYMWSEKSQIHAVIVQCRSKVMLTGVERGGGKRGYVDIMTFAFLFFFYHKYEVMLANPCHEMKKWTMFKVDSALYCFWHWLQLSVFYERSWIYFFTLGFIVSSCQKRELWLHWELCGELICVKSCRSGGLMWTTFAKRLIDDSLNKSTFIFADESWLEILSDGKHQSAVHMFGNI